MLKIIREKSEVNEEERIVRYVIRDAFNNEYIGIAKCHPDDCFRETGGRVIAEARARIKFMRAIIRDELYPKKECLIHLLSTYRKDDNTYKVERELSNVEEDITTVKAFINNEQEYLRTCIDTLNSISARAKQNKQD